MGKYDDYFYGYMQWIEHAYANSDRVHNPALGKYDFKNTFMRAQRVDVVVEKTWLEAFEEYFPYVDNCIRELRSYLRKEDIIAIVELANNVDINQSLTYLTQHTDAIIDYDEINLDITPGKLINSIYESTYNIYENLFINTLVHKCQAFLGTFYNDIEEMYNKEQLDLKINQDQENRTLVSNSELSIALKYDRISDKRILSDGSELDDVARLMALHEQLSDFMDSELIRSLRNTKFIEDPLTMTNVLLKNPNFIKAVEFWNFLRKYNKDKIIVKNINENIRVTSRVRTDLFEVDNILSFLMRLSLDEKFRKLLNVKYKKRKAQEVSEQKRLAKQEKERFASELEEGVTKRTAKYQHAMDKQAERYEEKLERFRQLTKTDYDYDVITKCNDIVAQLRDEQEAILENLVSAHNDEIASLHAEHDLAIETSLAELNSTIKTMTADHKAEVKSINAEHDKKLRAVDKQHTQEIAELSSKVETELASERRNLLLKERAMEANFNEKLDTTKKAYDQEIEQLNAQHIQDINTIGDKYIEQIHDLAIAHRDDLTQLKAHQAEVLKGAQAEAKLREAELRSKAKEQKTYFETQMHNMSAANAQRIADINQKHADSIQSLADVHAEELRLEHEAGEQQRIVMLRQIEVIEQDHAEQLEQQQTKSEEMLYKQQAKADKAMAQLQARTDKQLSQQQAKTDKAMSQLQNKTDKAIFKLQSSHAKQLYSAESANHKLEDKLAKAQLDGQDKLAKSEQVARNRYDKLKASSSKKYEGLQAKMEKSEAKHQRDMDTLSVKHDGQIATIDSQHGAQLASVQQQFDDKLKHSVEAFDLAVQALKAEQQQKLEEVDANYLTQMQECSTDYESRQQAVVDRMNSNQTAYEENIASINQRHAQQLQALNDKHQQYVEQSQQELAQYRAQYDSQIAQLEQRQQALVESHSKQIDVLQQQMHFVAASDAEMSKFDAYKAESTSKLRQANTINRQLTQVNDILLGAFDLIDYLASHPYVDKYIVASILGISDSKAAVFNKKLVEMNVLVQLPKRGRYVRADRGLADSASQDTSDDNEGQSE